MMLALLWLHPACTALLYASSHPRKVGGLVLDSPFRSLRDLALFHPEARKALPQPAGSYGLRVLYPFVRRSVHRRSGLKLNRHLNIIDAAARCPPGLPAAFISAEADPIVPGSHAGDLHAAYPGAPKRHTLLTGKEHDHNTKRPEVNLAELADFLAKALAVV